MFSTIDADGSFEVMLRDLTHARTFRAMRFVLTLAALAAAAVLAAPSHAARPITCKKSTINGVLDAEGKNKGEDISRIVCKDLTGDGVKDALFTVYSGGTAGDIAFGVITGPGGVLAHYGKGYKVGVDPTSDTSFDVQQPIYRRTDPNCCPSKFAVTPYRWNGKKFKAGQATKSKESDPRFYPG
jgi:hypothetical protein